MASTLDFLSYVTGQMEGAGEIAHKSMFGEYIVYLDGKYVAAVCDNQVFVKVTKTGRTMLEEKNALVEAPAYEGAKPSFRIDDLEDREFLKKLLQATWKEVPAPKPRKKPEKKEKK